MKSFNISNISTPTSLRTNLSDVFSSPFADCSPGAPQATSSPHTNTTTRLRTPVKDNMKLAIVNCNSIVNKIQEFQTFLSVTDPDLVMGTESWLKPDITNSEVFPPEYAVFRRDRKSDTKKSGGGVFILARKEYICTEIQVDINCEFQAIELQLKDQQNVKICNFYRPPWTDDSYFEDFIIAMQQVDAKGKGNIWVGGDFNLPDIDWSDVKLLPGNVNVNLSNSLIDLMNDMALTQVVDHPTRKNSILDLFFTSNATLVNRFTTTPPLTVKADHDIVFVDLNTRPHLPKQSQNTRYLYNKADWEGMRKKMSSYRLPVAPVQEQWDNLEATIKSLVESFVPSRPPKSPKHKPWITREVLTTIHRRNRAFKSWKRNPTLDNHKRYVALKGICQRMQRQAYKLYTESLFDPQDEKHSQTKFWQFVKLKRKDSCGIAPMRKEGILISDSSGKANVLNRQYSSVFTPIKEEVIPSSPQPGISKMPHIFVEPEGVKKLLSSLNPNKAASPDRISSRVLKELADQLYRPLTTLFQKSLNSGLVPNQWKSALVTPIFKKGDKHNPANYRPVSLTSICCKVLEHIVAKALLCHLESNKILIENQHGFIHSRSCETQLLMFVDELLRSMSKGKQIDAVIMDFSKTFDMVPHNSLLVKLSGYGIQDKTLDWIGSFLSDRSQRVVVEGEQSDPAPVTSGVPQGSVLGPILFLVFINDLPKAINSSCRVFADDMIVYREISSPTDSAALQHDLEALQCWEKRWGMSFNPSKCNTINITRKEDPLVTEYTLKDEPLENVKIASYLGIQISRDLSWHSHVAKVSAKGNKSLGFIRRNIRTSSKATKTLAYQTLVRPSLEYASCVWAPHLKHLREAIEKIQRRAVHYVCGIYEQKAPITDTQTELGWDTLEQRRLKSVVTMGYKIVNNLVAVPSTQLKPNTRGTRGNGKKFHQIYAGTNYYKFSFFAMLVPLWNALPSNVVLAVDLEGFKDALTKVHVKSIYPN